MSAGCSGSGGQLTFAAARAAQAENLAAAITEVTGTVGALAAAGRLALPGPIFTGIGASLAAACAPVWSLRSRGIGSVRLGAGETPLPFPPTTHPVVGVSQSGRSAETLALLESVAPTLRYAVVNAVPSPIAEVASTVIGLGNRPDSYASTVGYTATVAALGILADAWDGGVIDPSWADLGALFAEVERQLAGPVGELAVLFDGVTSADFIGAGPSVGSAEAAALLFREAVRLPSAGIGTRQYLHGSMESAGNSVHLLFGGAREAEVAGTLAAAGHRAIMVTSDPSLGGAAAVPGVALVRLPATTEAQQAILEVLTMQILVAAVAERRGVDIEDFVFHNSDTKVPASESVA